MVELRLTAEEKDSFRHACLNCGDTIRLSALVWLQDVPLSSVRAPPAAAPFIHGSTSDFFFLHFLNMLLKDISAVGEGAAVTKCYLKSNSDVRAPPTSHHHAHSPLLPNDMTDLSISALLFLD